MNKEYDERQLKIRGDIYQRGFAIIILLMMANGALQEFGLRWAPPFGSTLIIVMLAVVVTTVEMIIRDAYIGVRSRYSAATIMVLLGLCAALNIGINLLNLSHLKEPFLEDGILSMTGTNLIFWGLYMVMFLAMLGKKIVERVKREKEEEA